MPLEIRGTKSSAERFRRQLDADVDFAALKAMKTPQQIDAWLAQNVSNIAQARRVLARLLWYVIAKG